MENAIFTNKTSYIATLHFESAQRYSQWRQESVQPTFSQSRRPTWYIHFAHAHVERHYRAHDQTIDPTRLRVTVI